jgi:hypothetical protein
MVPMTVDYEAFFDEVFGEELMEEKEERTDKTKENQSFPELDNPEPKE